jgi:hypothetical protein
MTEVGSTGAAVNEKQVKKSVIGQGAIFHETPLQVSDFVFSWIEDRLMEADLNKKIISQQVADLKGSEPNSQSKQGASVLEAICINRDVDSVYAVHHFSFLKPRDWNTPLLTQFSATPNLSSAGRTAQFKLPGDAKIQLIRQGGGIDSQKPTNVSISLHDVLHVEWLSQEYYFRVVPKVNVPTVRRSIWSDPFYLICSFCLLIGAFGFFLVHRNIKDIKPEEITPPRIAQIEVMEVAKPPPPPEEPDEELASNQAAKPSEPEPPPEVAQEAPPEPERPSPPAPVPDRPSLAQEKNEESIDPTKNVAKVKPVEEMQQPNKIGTPAVAPTAKIIEARETKKVQDAPKVVDRNKGGLDIPAEKAAVNRTGFLAAIKRNKNVGMVRADQIIEKGIVSQTVKGKKGDFVLEQSASGIVNNKVRKEGEALAAASTKVNLGDRVGSGSLNVPKGENYKEGFTSKYASTGIGGGGDFGMNNFGGLVEAQVEGGLDKASVQSAIRAFKSEVRTCYEKSLRVKSGVGGRVAYKFQIGPKGNVVWINVHKSDVESGTLVNCVQSVVKGIEFPKAKNGQSTVVIYPFQFARKGS